MTGTPRLEASTFSRVCAFEQPPLAEAILVVLFGLTATTALDAMFEGVPKLLTAGQVWASLSHDKPYTLLLVVQLLVFLFTLLRFYFGSLRFHQLCKRTEHHRSFMPLLYDVTSNSIIFIGLYLAAKAIRSTDIFYWYVAAFHALDVLWFSVLLAVEGIPFNLRRIVKRFVVYDLITIGTFVAAVFEFNFSGRSQYYGQWLVLGVLTVVGLVDFKQNKRFYLLTKRSQEGGRRVPA